jgi:hypothetical protein
MQVCKKNDIYIKTRAQCPIQNASRMWPRCLFGCISHCESDEWLTPPPQFKPIWQWHASILVKVFIWYHSSRLKLAYSTFQFRFSHLEQHENVWKTCRNCNIFLQIFIILC